MLRASSNQNRAIRGMASAAPGFFKEYIAYLKASRDYERSEMENSQPANTEILKGQCRILSEQITNLESLLAKSGE